MALSIQTERWGKLVRVARYPLWDEMNNKSKNSRCFADLYGGAIRRRQGHAFRWIEADLIAVSGNRPRRVIVALPFVLSFGPKEWHMSGQRWRATRCDGADSSGPGALECPLQPQSGKLAPSPARVLCAIAGEGGGRGLPYLLESEK